MAKLSEPTMELAARILMEVGFHERIIGAKMAPMAGNRICSIYSFEEALDFLHMGSSDDILIRGKHSLVGYLDLEQLKIWVRDVFGDNALAEAIDKAVRKSSHYMGRVKSVKELMRQRLNQCKYIAANNADLLHLV